MNCPVCNETLLLTNRQEVEIDYCPECRGIWLDRGELDKIIERSGEQTPAYIQPEPQYQQPLYSQQHRKPHHDDHSYGNGGYHKKKNWLTELFD